VAACSVLLLLFSCQSRSPHIAEHDAAPSPAAEEPPPLFRLRIIAAGDNLLHDTIIRGALEKDGYHFAPIYADVRPIIEAADIAFVNQETVMGGEQYGYSGYPRFNSPGELASALGETGFDIVNHANNHALDMGAAGLLATMDTWDAVSGVQYIGVRRHAEQPPLIVVKNNIRLGFLAYTQHTNGIALPPGRPWMVSLAKREVMAREIEALRPFCDFVIVSMHWGPEYEHEPSADQLALAEFLAEQRVDLVIGHHPHVLQRFELLPRPDGGKMLCFYSLGAFVSHQWQPETLLGGLMYVELLKEGETVSVGNAGIIPVLTHFEQGFSKTRIIPLYSYTAALAERHRLRAGNSDFTVDFFYAIVTRLYSRVIMYNPFSPSPAGAEQ
jgi:poly-gamma-glutamate synthesis protein (capsule biosynthesis protein)